MEKSGKSIVSFLLIIIILAIGYFGAYGQWQSLSEARAAQEVSKQENVRLKQVQADVNSFLSKYESNKEKVGEANRVLPLGDLDAPILLGNLSKLVSDSGLNLVTINLYEDVLRESQPAPNSIQSVDVELQMGGSYEAFKDFLLRLQNSRRLSDIVDLNISKDDQNRTGNGNVLDFSLTLRVYYQK